MFIIRPCQTYEDYAYAAELAAELAAWDSAETQKLGLRAEDVLNFYYPVEGELHARSAATSGTTLLALAEGTPAACISFRELGPGSCELKRLYVRPAFRGTGLGRRMIGSLIQTSTIAGYSHVCLETVQFMRDAIRLYEQAGFVPCEPYYPIPEMFRAITVFMQKELVVSAPALGLAPPS